MVPVQLDEMEDQFDHADDQDPNLDELGKCDHDKPPFLTKIRDRGQRSAPCKQHEVEREGNAPLPPNRQYPTIR